MRRTAGDIIQSITSYIEREEIGELVREANEGEGFKEILQVVAEMRRWQKQYYRTGKNGDLTEAKRLETSVDMRLSEAGFRSH